MNRFDQIGLAAVLSRGLAITRAAVKPQSPTLLSTFMRTVALTVDVEKSLLPEKYPPSLELLQRSCLDTSILGRLVSPTR